MAKTRPVRSLGDLFALASASDAYQRLLEDSAENLGGDPSRAVETLRNNAMETSEEGVVDEVNSLLALDPKRYEI